MTSDAPPTRESGVAHALARFNRRLLNPVVRPAAARAPGFAVVHHTGRRSGTPFTTPVRVFSNDGTFYVMIANGRTPDWVRNLEAAGGGQLRLRRRTVDVGPPRLADVDEAMASASRGAKSWRRSLGLTRFVALPST